MELEEVDGVPVIVFSFFDALGPYRKDFPMKCPSDPIRAQELDWTDNNTGKVYRVRIPSYGYNALVAGHTKGGNELHPDLFKPTRKTVNERDVADPPSLITFADGANGLKGRLSYGLCLQHAIPDTGQQRDKYGKPYDAWPFPAYDRHNGGANYVFFDGHVKWLPATDKRIWGFNPWDVPPAWLPNADYLTVTASRW